MSITKYVVRESMYVGSLACVKHRTASNSVLRAGANTSSAAGPIAAHGVSSGPGFQLFSVSIRTFTNQGVCVNMRGAICVRLGKQLQQATKK